MYGGWRGSPCPPDTVDSRVGFVLKRSSRCDVGKILFKDCREDGVSLGAYPGGAGIVRVTLELAYFDVQSQNMSFELRNINTIILGTHVDHVTQASIGSR